MQNHTVSNKLSYSIGKTKNITSPHTNRVPLHVHVEQAIKDYFSDLDGQAVTGLYNTVLAEVEVPLLNVVLKHCKTKSEAVNILGLSPGTLRKKLKQYHLA